MNSIGEILLLKEERYGDKESEFYREDGGMYDLPGGGLNWWEDFRIWLIREITEEMWVSEDAFEVANDPFILQVVELDDRYHQNEEMDDFYPVLMVYFPVRFLDLNFGKSRGCASYIWLPIHKFSEKQIWSHSANLASVFTKENFPLTMVTHE
jgi:hypothetical protein